MKTLVFLIFLGCSMFSSAKELPNFDELWDYENPAQTQTKFLGVLKDTEGKSPKDYHLQLLTQIARTDSLQAKFAEAHNTLDAVRDKLDKSTAVAEVRYLLERGRAFNSSKKKEDAVPLFAQAYELSLDRKLDYHAIDAAHMLAIAEKDSAKQMEWNLKALKHAEDTSDSRAKKWLASLYNNIGWTFHDTGKFEEALATFKKGLALREKGKGESEIRIAKWSVARALRSLKKYDEALKIQRALEAEFTAIHSKDGYVFEELAELLFLAGKKEEARKYFAFAYEELSKDIWLKNNEPKRLDRLKELGEKG